jgi:nucleotidyltransferase substrate binding protein (TIGR01987 family)
VELVSSDVRWKQRLQNFSRALAQLTEFVQKQELSNMERQGLIQCFEYTFELGWKTLKDYLEQGGYTLGTPRSVIQQAFQLGLISSGHQWIDALEKRNYLAHSYNEEYAALAENLIRKEYFQMLVQALDALEDLR